MIGYSALSVGTVGNRGVVWALLIWPVVVINSLVGGRLCPSFLNLEMANLNTNRDAGLVSKTRNSGCECLLALSYFRLLLYRVGANTNLLCSWGAGGATD